MKKFALLLAAALLTLVALAQTDTPTVDETISALESGLTNIPLDAALANIEGWQTTLEASDDTAVQALGAQLGELATALQAETIDGQEVGGLLTSLGEGTVAAAGGDAQLESLGNLLTQAGGSLVGGGMTGGMTGGMSGGAVGSAATLEVSQTDELGEFLVDAEGMTLYMFTNDTENTSTCYGDCAEAWPPVLTEGDPTLGEGLDAALVSTTERTDGAAQVTYGGMPLYYWVNDAAPGDTTGQNVGEVWFVVSPAGEIVQ